MTDRRDKQARRSFPRWILAALLLLLTLPAGCRSGSSQKTLEEGQYDTYYVNQAGTSLIRTVYETDTSDTESLIRELFAQCQTVPEGTDGRRAIPSNVTMAQDPVYENRIVNIYFDNTYSLMDTVTALLCRAALAKTLTQLEDVDYIALFINGKPYTGETVGAEENPEGGQNQGLEGGAAGNQNSELASNIAVIQPLFLSGSDFVDNTGDATNQYEQMDMVLYFASPDGSGLVEEPRSVVYSSNLSAERVIMNQLIAGPADSRLMATLPSGLKVQSISLRDGVCYLDLDAVFLTETTNVMGTVEIYSIVNSLTEISTISQVQISINGSSTEVFRNSIPLSDRFERNNDLIVSLEEAVETHEDPAGDTKPAEESGKEPEETLPPESMLEGDGNR